MKFYLVIILVLIGSAGFGQPPVVDFSFDDNACLEANINLQNLSTNADSYFWDFCTGDLGKTNLSVTEKTFTGLAIPVGTALIEHNGNWYGFITNINNSSITRLSFGSSLHNPDPVMVNLGNYGGLLSGPQDIKAVEDNGNCYLFVSNRTTNKLIKISLGGNIVNPSPSAQALLTGAADVQNNGIEVVKDGIDWYVFYSTQNRYILLKLGSSLSNSPEDIINGPVISGANNIGDISIVKDGSNWHGFVVSYTSKTLHRLDFGTSLANVPTFTNITTSNISAYTPYSIEVKTEGDKRYAFISNSNGNLVRLDFIGPYSGSFGFNLLGNYGLMNNTFKLNVAFGNSEWLGLSSNWSTNRVYLIRFPNNCSAVPMVSRDFSPVASYTTSGIHPVNLTAYHTNGSSASVTKVITVSPNEAPNGDIVLDDAYCIANEIEFSFASQDIVDSYLWDFGDGNLSSEIAPVHNYIASGSYIVTLVVESLEGCKNIYSKGIHIYDVPQPGISTDKTTYCSFEDIAFENTTEGNFGGNVIWSWDFDEEGISAELSPVFSFETSGEKTVTLSANMLGCRADAQLNIEIVEGPHVDFVAGPVCFGEHVSFTNLTVGEGIMGQFWDFGNGTTSTEEHSTAVFAEAGTYDVRLTVINASGCENAIIKRISVLEQIISDLFLSESVENIPFSASLALVEDHGYEIEEYLWSVDGMSDVSINPVFMLPSPGGYLLMVELTTTEGCKFDYSKEFTVHPSAVPTPDFIAPDDALCLNENILLENGSVNAVSYGWDFCSGDLASDAITVSEKTFTSLSIPIGAALIQHNSNWYGFVTNIGNSSITRLSFGQSLHNPDPVLTNLGNYGGMLSGPQDIKAVKENGGIYLFVSNRTTNKLVRINLGGDILNPSPSAQTLLTGAADILNNGIEVASDGENWYVFYSMKNSYTKIILGNSLSNNPSPDDITIGPLITGANNIGDIAIIKDGLNWYGFLVGYTSKTLHRLSFGSSLSNVPTFTNLTTTSISAYSPHGLVVKAEGEGKHLFITTFSGNLLRLDFLTGYGGGFDFNLLGTYGALNNTYKMDMANGNSEWIGLSSNWSNNRIYLVNFPNVCSASPAVSLKYRPKVSYSSHGTYPITLTAYHANGRSTSITKEITVGNNMSPSISFEATPNFCISAELNLVLSANQDISDVNWSFGDGSISNELNAVHKYNEPGSYSIQLEVNAANGCHQRAYKDISIYPEPIPDFTFPDGILCSHTNLPFTNTSQTFDADEVIQWDWDFNGEEASTLRDVDYQFVDDGLKMVSLTASIPGCSPKITKSFNITLGPEVNFTTANQCFGEELLFVNQSSGEGITQHKWNLGNGQTSFETSPALVYDTAGTYAVQLEVTNNLGCVNTLAKNVSVHFNPVTDFEYGLVCSSGTDFMDKTMVPRANITQWQWSLLKGGQFEIVSTQKNPYIVMESAGTHRVKLLTASNFGCKDSLEVELNALPGPVANFGNSLICVGDSIQFSDLSTTVPSNPITNWYWNINGKGYFVQNPKALFASPGDYQVSLKIDAQNNCSDMMSKTINAPRLPIPAFVTSRLCVNENIKFTDVSYSPDDPIKNWEWDFAGLAKKYERETFYKFPSATDYQVRLSVTTDNGCRRSMANSIKINPAPKAKFSLYPAIGTVPQPVAISNQSAGAIAYNWSFGEHSDSLNSGFEPQYTYQSIGDYMLKLVAISDQGCRDSVTNTISIRVPRLDVDLERIVKVVNNGDLQLVARINNLGSLVVEDLDILIDLGKIKMKEKYPGPLEAGAGGNYPLSIRIADYLDQGLEYVCITLEPNVLGRQDENLGNNKLCMSLNDLFSVLDPYPNPANKNIHITYVATNTDDRVSLFMTDLTGRTLFDRKVNPDRIGFNHQVVDVSDLRNGVYLLTITVNDKRVVKKILVEK